MTGSHRLLRHVRSGLRLSPREALEAAEAAALFYTFKLVLRVVPVRKLRWVLGTEGPPAPILPADTVLQLPPAVFAVRRALRRSAASYEDTCLPQSLAGRVMLRRRGLPSALSLGTRRENGQLKFHAWISTGGLPLNSGGGPRRHTVLTTFYDTPTATGTALPSPPPDPSGLDVPNTAASR